MKYADKTGAKTVLVIGDNELASGEAELKDMRGGENKRVSISAEEIAKALK